MSSALIDIREASQKQAGRRQPTNKHLIHYQNGQRRMQLHCNSVIKYEFADRVEQNEYIKSVQKNKRTKEQEHKRCVCPLEMPAGKLRQSVSLDEPYHIEA